MTLRPTHLLRHEHRVIERVLRAMNGVCLRLRLGDRVPQVALLKIVDFATAYADHYHHEREEKHLFPALVEAGVNKAGALEFLRGEHVIERDLLRRLETAASSFDLDNRESVEHFVETCERFSRHLIGHMQKEDSLLFRIAEELLDESAKHSLMLALGENDQDSIQRYERVAEELEIAWAV